MKTPEQYLECLHKCAEEDLVNKEMDMWGKYVRLLGGLTWVCEQIQK